MSTTVTTQDSDNTLGAVAQRYARQLQTALITAGAPGRVRVGRYDRTDPAAHEGPHTQWPFIAFRVGGADVQMFCLPTSTGIVLLVQTPDGVSRCLPTWGAPACAFGPAALAVAREIITATHGHAPQH